MAKTATFGVLHLITAFSITYTMTGSAAIAGAVTFVEPLANTVVHYFLDKYWDHPRAQAMRATVARRVEATHARLTASQTQQSPEVMHTVRA